MKFSVQSFLIEYVRLNIFHLKAKITNKKYKTNDNTKIRTNFPCFIITENCSLHLRSQKINT
jgi:hypothetical protein